MRTRRNHRLSSRPNKITVNIRVAGHRAFVCPDVFKRATRSHVDFATFCCTHSGQRNSGHRNVDVFALVVVRTLWGLVGLNVLEWDRRLIEVHTHQWVWALLLLNRSGSHWRESHQAGPEKLFSRELFCPNTKTCPRCQLGAAIATNTTHERTHAYILIVASRLIPADRSTGSSSRHGAKIRANASAHQSGEYGFKEACFDQTRLRVDRQRATSGLCKLLQAGNLAVRHVYKNGIAVPAFGLHLFGE